MPGASSHAQWGAGTHRKRAALCPATHAPLVPTLLKTRM